MTSSIERKPNRRLVWLALLVVVVCGAYSAGWFYLADRVRTEAGKAIAGLDAAGVNADCANLQIGGFPFRFAVTCDSMAYQDDTRNIAASTGAINAVARIYRPLSPVADVVGPLRTSVPGMAPLWLDWDRLQVGMGLSWPLPQRISLNAEGLSGQTDPQDDTDPVQLFSAGEAEGQLRPNGKDLDYTGSFSDLQLDPEAVDGRAIPLLAGKGDLTLKDGMALTGARIQSLRGRAFEIRLLDLSSGEARVSVSGPVSVDAKGRVEARLSIKIHDPKALAGILATTIPERKREIEQGFAALALLGNEPSMPLRIVKGKASLGFIPLGKIKPVK